MRKRFKKITAVMLAATLAAGSATCAFAAASKDAYSFSYSNPTGTSPGYLIEVESASADTVTCYAAVSGASLHKITVTVKNAKTGKVVKKVVKESASGGKVTKKIKNLKNAKYTITVKISGTKKNGKPLTVKQSETIRVK